MKHAIINREFGEVRTVIVLGVGRGGTSLIAGCLRALGISMGMEPYLFKHEWSPIIYLSDGNVDAAATYRVIEEMNRGHERWGWKSPRDIFALKQVVSLVRAPGFVVVTRYLFEASFSGLTYQGGPLRYRCMRQRLFSIRSQRAEILVVAHTHTALRSGTQIAGVGC